MQELFWLCSGDGDAWDGSGDLGEGKGKRRPWGRLTEGERAQFIEVLRESGNRRMAAEAIGIEPRLMDQRREHDAELDRAWEQAAEEAHRRLSGVEAPFDSGAGGTPRAIRRGKNGRLQRVEPGVARWSAAVEARFLEALRLCGNVRASAKCVGFSESTVWTRRRQWPAFAKAMEEMLEEAELALEYRIACMASGAGPGEPAPGEAAGDEGSGTGDLPPALGFDPDFAMRFLKWREEKRRGGGRRTPLAAPPSIEDVTEKLMRRIEAIKRHGRRGGDGGAAGAPEGGA
jgi:hypothetical protein